MKKFLMIIVGILLLILLCILLKTTTHTFQGGDMIRYRGCGGRVLYVVDEKHLEVLCMSGTEIWPTKKCRYVGKFGEVSSNELFDPEPGFEGLLYPIAFLLFITPIGWGILILIILTFLRGTFRTTKKIITTDWQKIPDRVKRSTILDELEK